MFKFRFEIGSLHFSFLKMNVSYRKCIALFNCSAPQLPGSVVVHTATNSSSSSNLSRRVPLGTTTSSSSMTSSLSSHPMASAGAVEEDGRWSEIERRNSMYPKHLQSSYPTEEIVHNNTQVSSYSSTTAAPFYCAILSQKLFFFRAVWKKT